MLLRPLDDRDLSIIISELLVATADSSDPLIDGSVPGVLRMLRDRLQLDVVFVSEFVNGQRVFRFVDNNGNAPVIKPGDAGPLEASYCQRVVDGRLPGVIHDAGALPRRFDVPPTPFRVGGHISTPIMLKNGHVFGTLCCFSTAPSPQLQAQDLATLERAAQLVARKLELTVPAKPADMPPRDAPATDFASTDWIDPPPEWR